MIKVTAPDDKVRDVFMLCISLVRNKQLKADLTNSLIEIIKATNDYASKAKNGELYKIKSHLNVGVVQAEEMLKVYNNRMVKPPGRPYYDKFLRIPPQGKCPYCGHRQVSQLDHYLPESLYPSLVVTPVNLVASCGDCNKSKLHFDPQKNEEQILHPYYDDIEGDSWLVATVHEESPVRVSFDVSVPVTWPTVLGDRVKFHFSKLNLASLYAFQAAEELVNIRFHLDLLFKATDMNGVKNNLKVAATSRAKVRINSWQAALYKALSESDWYCSGGFRM